MQNILPLCTKLFRDANPPNLSRRLPENRPNSRPYGRDANSLGFLIFLNYFFLSFSLTGIFIFLDFFDFCSLWAEMWLFQKFLEENCNNFPEIGLGLILEKIFTKKKKKNACDSCNVLIGPTALTIIFWLCFRVFDQHKMSKEQWEERITNWYAEHKGMMRWVSHTYKQKTAWFGYTQAFS